MSPKRQAELESFRSFLLHNRNNLPAINQAALLMQQQSYPLDLALGAYEQYLSQNPHAANAAFNYAWYLSKNGQFEAAITEYSKALELGVEQPEEAYLNIGNIYMDHLHDHEKAREALQQSLEINPRYVGAYHNLGNLAEQLGDRDHAAACFEKCLEIDPRNDRALARLADSHEFVRDDDPLLARLIAATDQSDNSDLFFALGSAFNQLGKFNSAWLYLSKGNTLDRKTLPPYDRDRTEMLFNRIRSQCGRDWFGRIQGTSDEPVFICGMFRTGSTLLEQVLAAHPGFTAGGESEFFPRLIHREFHDYPEGLDEITSEELQAWRDSQEKYSEQFTGGVSRLTDKRPDNFLYLGLIKVILPSAKFVVTERDWRDVALSIFSTRLGATQTYSTDLADIRHYVGLQKGLVDHWESIMGEDLVRVSYEDLVGQPRETIEKLLQRLGEDWDEGCLNFDQLDNPVKTASVWQVREPLHSRSIGRWKNYQTYFEKVFGADISA